MLWEGQKAISVLCNIDEENKGYTYMFWWFNVCCIRLETFKERLTLDDVVAEDEATQTGAGDGSSHAIDESESFGRLVFNTIKELMSYPKCRSVTVINNPARPGLNHREVNYINYNNNNNNNNNNENNNEDDDDGDDELKRTLRSKINVTI